MPLCHCLNNRATKSTVVRFDGVTASLFYFPYTHIRFTSTFLCAVLIIWPFVTFIDAETVQRRTHSLLVFSAVAAFDARYSSLLWLFSLTYTHTTRTVVASYAQGWGTTEFPVNTHSSVFALCFHTIRLSSLFFFGRVTFFTQKK